MNKPLGTFTCLSTSNLSTPDFKQAKSFFLSKSDVATPVSFF